MRHMWSKLRLGPRISIMMFLTLLLFPILNAGLLTALGTARVYIYEESWLVSSMTTAVTNALEMQKNDPSRPFSPIPSGEWLQFRISDKPAYKKNIPHDGLLKLFQEHLEKNLGPAHTVIIHADKISGDPKFETKEATLIVEKLPFSLEIKQSFQDDKTIFTSNLSISVKLNDGLWLVAENKGHSQTLLPRVYLLSLIAISIGLILALSFWITRSIITPLAHLEVAAERLGREREITPIPDLKIPEYNAIASTFNEMQKRLKRFIDDRTHMLAAISHDLRTPLTRLRLLAESLQDVEKRAQVISDLSDMDVMIKSSLAFAKNEFAKEPYVEFDVASLLISLCDSSEDAGYNVQYKGDNHSVLRCQPVAIRRAMNNLIENGVKYGDHVTVTLENSENVMTILIQDEGPGIPEDKIEQAFAPFQRLEESRNRNTGGTGLGLTIARDIILGHGGYIHLSNLQPKGLLVTVTLYRREDYTH